MSYRTVAGSLFVGVLSGALLVGCNPAGPPAKPTASKSTEGKSAAGEWVASPAKAPVSAKAPAAKPAAPAAETKQPAEAGAKAEAPAPAIQSAGTTPPYLKDVPLIARDVLFGNPDKAAARMSHDSKQLAYLAAVDGVLNVWVGPIDNPAAAKPVTKDKKRGIHGYFWAYTNKHVLYTQDQDGNENDRVYAVDLTTNETRDLTPLENVQAQIQAVSFKFPDELLVGLNDRDPQVHDVYRVNIQTGERKLVQKNEEKFSGYVADEDFRIRFAVRYSDDGGREILEPDGSGGWKTFMRVPQADALTTGPAGFDKTGNIVYLEDSRDRDTAALYSLDLKTGAKKLIAANDKADVGAILSHPTENTVEAVSFTYTRQQWEVIDPKVGEDLRYLRTVDDGDIQIPSRSLDDKNWIVAYLKDDGPVRYYFYRREPREAKFLFTNRKSLEDLPLVKMHPIVITSRDGLNLVCYLTLPPGTDDDNDARPDKPLPMVLDVHGGPWSRDSWGFNSEHQLLANRGYAVLAVNFRGSTGLGKSFLNAGNKEWAAKMHDDLLDAVDYCVKHEIADPKRVAIMGGSYGGYATLVGLTFTPDVFACGIDVVGPSNIITLLNAIPPYWQTDIQLFKDRVGDHTTEEGRKFLTERSPLTYVDKIKRPLLIAQGANDPRVKKSEADQIVQAMEAKKIPVIYLLYPDEGHGFRRPANNKSYQAVLEAFLAKHLGGRYQPIGGDFAGATISVPTGADDVPGLVQALKEKK
ncbi:MAG: S9 family peptidase [Planctomycetes bacterium]|nr:S9 family peptidase [Planctomycetota bacterium]